MEEALLRDHGVECLNVILLKPFPVLFLVLLDFLPTVFGFKDTNTLGKKVTFGIIVMFGNIKNRSFIASF
jgi:hypothetical protein